MVATLRWPAYIAPMRHPLLSIAMLGSALAGCARGEAAVRVPLPRDPGPAPDEMPTLINAELPFRYPAVLYARKVQGNVTLRLYIDADGRVVDDSTRIDQGSGFPALDSAARKGSSELRFVPAKLRGETMAISLLFPVYFRHPEARALPGDSALRASARGAGGRGGA